MLFGFGGHRDDAVAHVADLVVGQQWLVLIGRPEGDNGDFLAGQGRHHAGHFLRLADIDAENFGVRVFTAQDFRIQHVGKGHVVDVDGLTENMGAAVGAGHPLADGGGLLIDLGGQRQQAVADIP